MVVFADTSAIVRAYLKDEPNYREMARVLFEEPSAVVASTLAELEFVSAVRRATRQGRINKTVGDQLIEAFANDTARGGPIALVRLEPDTTFAAARGLLLRHPLRTLDALQLAAALDVAAGSDESVVFCTGDTKQADAAQAEGIEVYPS